METKKLHHQGLQYWTTVYFLCMFLVFPLYFQNNYIDILEAKTTIFKILTIIYLIGGATIAWLISVFEAEEKRKWKKKYVKRSAGGKAITLACDKWLLFFVCIVIFSSIVSGDFSKAWYAPDGKLFGTMIILLCCGVYYLTSKGIVINKVLESGLITGCDIVSILMVLNRYRIDPLNMYSNLNKMQRGIYASTIGNTNILSGYLCIFIPIFAGVFLWSKCFWRKVVYGLCFYIGVMAGIATNSDSFFIGTSTTMLIFLWFSMEDREKFLTYVRLCVLGVCACASLQLFNRIGPHRYYWESIQKYLVNEIPWLWILLISLLFLGFIYWFGKMIPFMKVRRLVFMAIGIVFVGFIVYVLKININGTDSESSILFFNDEWGTNRGFVWKRTLILFKELPFYQKIIGIGPGAFKDFFAIYNEERLNMSMLPFADPHSELLYYLISTGILGVISYFGIFVSAIVNCIKNRNEKNIILAAVFLTWIAQGTVNNPIVFTTPFLFMFLGLSSYETKIIMRKH